MKARKYPLTTINEHRTIDFHTYFQQLVSGNNDKLQFQQNGLHCNKTLINYDVWEDVFI